MFTDRSRRAVTVGIAVLAMLGLIGMMMAPLASAHERLTGSTPEDGAQVEAPGELVLEFSGDLSELGVAVEVSGPEGQAADGEPTTEGSTLRQPLADDLPPGEYAVTWRVTSGDGHPISGELSFEVTGSAEPEQTEAAAEGQGDPQPAATEQEPAAAAADDGAMVSPADEGGEAGESPVRDPDGAGGLPGWLWILIGVLALLAIAGVAAAAMRGRSGAAR